MTSLPLLAGRTVATCNVGAYSCHLATIPTDKSCVCVRVYACVCVCLCVRTCERETVVDGMRE